MRYPAERKEAILKKMAPPMSMTIPELAEQEGITATTLYNWRKQARARGQVLPSRSTKPDHWTSQEKFQIVLETAPMNEAEVSAYCRERGLYPEQVEAWRDACMNANDDAAAQAKQLRQARKAEQKRLRSANCTARTRPWPRRRRCWPCQKRPRRSGARPTTRTTDQPPGSPAYRDPGARRPA